MRPSAGREPILNLPGVVTAVLGALTAIETAAFVLPASVVDPIFAELAFIPARVSFALAPETFMRTVASEIGPGVDRADLAAALHAETVPWWTLFTYALLHANWTHLAVNGVTLAAFGSPLARRFGAGRFLVFLALTAAAGAAAHLALHPFDLAPVVGASAAISGTMAASARFAFAPESTDGGPRAWPRGSLSDLWRNRQALAFLGLWFAANLLFGLFPGATGGTEQIAWEAHIGGFVAGLLLFGVFDRRIGFERAGRP
jgi:membrane associated rhomboid family serine protease